MPFYSTRRVKSDTQGVTSVLLQGCLTTSFSDSELSVPLNECRSIPLEGWKQTPRVSLQSVARDLAVTEPCNCCLPNSTALTITLSSSEDENIEGEVWVRNVLYSLTHKNQETILSPSGWLTDKVITAAQILIPQHFPNMLGLQPPPLQEVSAFHVHSGEFVQIMSETITGVLSPLLVARMRL